MKTPADTNQKTTGKGVTQPMLKKLGRNMAKAALQKGKKS